MITSVSEVLICLVVLACPLARSSKSQWRLCQCGSRGPISWGGRTRPAARPSTPSWIPRSASVCPRPSTSDLTWKPTLIDRWLLNPVTDLSWEATSTITISLACQRRPRLQTTLCILPLRLTNPAAATATETGIAPEWETRWMTTVTPVRIGGTTSITAIPKTTVVAIPTKGRRRGPAAEKEAEGITIRAQWTTAEVEEWRVRESTAIIIHIGSLEEAMGRWTVEEGESVGLATKMDIHQTWTEKGIPEEIVASMEKGGNIGPMDPGASPRLRERNPTRGKRLTVTGKNHNSTVATAPVFTCFW